MKANAPRLRGLGEVVPAIRRMISKEQPVKMVHLLPCIALLNGMAIAHAETSTADVTVTSAPGAEAPADTAVGAQQPEGAAPAASETLTIAPQSTPRLTLGGAIRGRYDLRFNNADGAGNRRTSSDLSFDTLILKMDYDSPTVFGAAQYRFYGGSFLYSRAYGYENYPGEVNFPVYAYVGAKLSPRDKVTVGIQPVPFDDQFWGSAFLNSMGFVMGLEEVYNAGISFSHAESSWKVEGGFFPTTAPNAFGISEDSARYSINIVKGDGPDAIRNAERNMAIGRVQYRLAGSGANQLLLSGSAWFSTIHNFDTLQDGSRRAFAVSLKGTQGPWRAKLLAARQIMSLRNPGRNDIITVGDYDAPFNIAADSKIYFGEIGRKVDTGSLPFDLDLFANYAYLQKDNAGFRDTQRLNVGAFWTDKATGKIRIWTEALVGRNDPYVGAGQYGSGAAAGGDDRTKVSVLMIFGYYF